MSFYKNLGNTAARLINQFGQQAIVEKAVKTNDAITGVVTEGPADYGVVSVVQVEYKQAFDGSLENAKADAVYLLASNDYVLELGHKVTFNDKEFFIKRLNPIRPGGEVVAYGVEVSA